MGRLLCLLFLLTAGSAVAGDLPHPLKSRENEPLDRAEENLRKGIEDLMQSFESLLEAIPRYDAPRLDEHGNIIIPRHARPPMPSPESPTLRT